MHLRFFSGISIAISFLAFACSASTIEQVQPTEQPSIAPSGEPSQPLESASTRPDEVPLIKGPVSEDGYQAIFATPDLGVGENRIGLVITSQTGLVRTPIATFTSVFMTEDNTSGERKETRLAEFHEFPLGTRGIYSTRMNFDQPGRWKIAAAVLDENGMGRQVEIHFEVMNEPETPAIGDAAIPSENKTLTEIEDIGELTTGSLQDADLYQLTIADALKTGKPTVVVMASPAFCTNAVCGPQVDVLSELKDMYKGQANFIHIDIYDNPRGIQGDLNNAIISPTVTEWNLPSSEWSFVIDQKGIISERFEAFATFEELEIALKSVL